MTDETTDDDAPMRGFFNDRAYHDALALVSETVTYLEGRGIMDRDTMDPAARNIFAAESMRLTTRLMQVVSWFLVQRAVQTGELTREQAQEPARQLGAVQVCLGEAVEGAEFLPARIKELLDRSRHIFEQVWRVEVMMMEERDTPKNPVHDLLSKLEL